MNGHYARIRSFAGRVRRLDWIVRASAALFRFGMVALAALSLHLVLIERIPDRPWLAFAMALAGSAAVWASLAVSVAASRPVSLLGAARRIEKVSPGFRDDVVTSLTMAPIPGRTGVPEGVSGPLLMGLLATTAEKMEPLSARRFVSWRPAATWSARCALMALPLLVLLVSGHSPSPLTLRALFDPSVYWPLGKVTFDVSPGAARIARGGSLEVTVLVGGTAPGAVVFTARGDDIGEEQYLMERAGDRSFQQKIPLVTGPLQYRVSAASSSSPWFPVEVVEPPTAGNFEVTYTYPAYTGLPLRTAEGNGNLEALRGTAVRVEFDVSKPLATGRLFLEESTYEIGRAADDRYGASFYLNGEGRYRLELTDREGFRNVDPLVRSIRYVEDDGPEVQIIAPTGEVVLGPFVQVPIVFKASDDFGLSRISVLTRDPGGAEKRETILSGEVGTRVETSHLWDAGGVDAPPGSLVPVFLEAVDNDTISGPKASLSNSFVLRIPDPEEEHRRTEEDLEELLDGLVDLLAEELDLLGRYEGQESKVEESWEDFSWEDFSESENVRRSLQDMSRDIARDLDSLQRQMALDARTQPEALFQMGLISRQLDEMRKMTLGPMEDLAESVDPAEADREEMKQKSGFLEKYARDAVEATEQMVLQAEALQREQNMADVRQSGEDMLSLQDEILGKLDDLEGTDLEAAREVLEDLARMEDLLRDLMEALSRESQSLPEEFLNSDALQNLPLTDIMKGIDEIRERLRAGDIEGARQAARDLLRDLGDLLNRLRQAGEEFQTRSGQAAARMKSSTLPALEKIIEEQENLLRRTEELSTGVEERLETAPRGKDTDDTPDRRTFLGAEEKARAGILEKEERELQDRTEILSEEIAALESALPFLDPAVESDLREGAGLMGEAVSSLEEGQPRAAVPSEREALGRLMSARDRARQSLQSMEQMMQLRNGQGVIPLYQGMGVGAHAFSPPTTGTSPGGVLGTDVRSFRIPGKEDYDTPPLFRQEILKSLSEGYPEDYEGRIRDYYHRIAE